MSEITMNLYVKHADRSTHRALGKLLRALFDDEQQVFRAAERIALDGGVELTQSLLGRLDSCLCEAGGFDDVEARNGFLCATLMSGAEAVELAPMLAEYFYSLNPDIQVLAYVYGDEDPWECWVKMHHGAPLVLECSPFSGNDEELVGTVYRWWHEGLPDAIREGFLYQDQGKAIETLPEAQYQEWLGGLK